MNYLYSLFFLLFINPLSAQNPASFEPDQQLRKSIKNTVWKELEKVTPKNQMTGIAFIFIGKMPYNSYAKLATQEGLLANDVATAHTFFKVVAWERLNNVILNNSQRKALYKQTLKQLSPFLKSKTNTEKQKLADPYILKATWANLTLEKAKNDNDQATVSALTSTVQQWFYQITGKIITEVTLDAKGFKDKGVVTTTSPPADPPSPKTTGAPGSIVKHTPSTPTHRNSLGVKDVIMRTVTSYGLGGTYLDQEVYVLFDNGEIYNNPKDSPGRIDRASFKQKKPKGWGTWKKQGNILVTTYPGKGKTYEWNKWFQVRAGAPGFRIEGKFESLDPFGGAVVVNSNIVSFNKQGQFAWKSLAGGQTAWLPVYSKKSSSGTYEIKNYSIVLNYNDGQKEEFFFGRYPKSEKHFIIGSGHFVPLDR